MAQQRRDGDDEFARYADPGYLDDAQPRLPLTTRAAAHVARDWIDGQAGAQYSVKQRKRVRERIMKALAELGE